MTHVSGQLSAPVGVSLQATVAALQLPGAYVEAPRSIRAIETHYSWVFLTERFAYKLKKPLHVSYFDWSTSPARRAACSEELRLNRPLAADVYHGIAAVALQPDGSLRVDGEGVTIDWLVRMRRLPVEWMLDAAIKRREVPEAALQEVARRLAEFHAVQPHLRFEPCGYRQRLASQIKRDESGLLAADLGISSTLVGSVAQLQRSVLARLEQEIELRAAELRVVEGHGDLRPEHICLLRPPCIIDALDFSRQLRILDVAEELAFLWMECAYAGASQVGEIIVDEYYHAARERASCALLDFYRSRRAMVRGKLMAWHLRDMAASSARKWRDRADEYLTMACDYAGRALVERD